ncbi:MAG: class I SAM-dependent methyltransferase [Bacteroidia bacterium]|nr:class I SAM-dependent methyltransferase [Bacteroidia bacterium]
MKTNASEEDVKSTSMLKTRVNSNKNSSKDFDEWCFQQIPEIPLDAKVLDLGCGNGKQLHLFSRAFSSKSGFWGMDISRESLDDVAKTYTSRPKLELIEGSFDKEESYSAFSSQKLDLVYAAYALYYTKNLKNLIKNAYNSLKTGGIFWVIGPNSGTNDEFLKILRPLHEVEPFMDYVFDDFMPEVIELSKETGFSSVRPSMLRNKVFFPSADAFMNYLSNSLFYRSGHDDKILMAVQEVVDREGVFAVSKNILSLQIRK